MDSSGLLGSARMATEASKGPADWLARLVDMVSPLLAQTQGSGRRVAAVGLGSPGVLDRAGGIILRSPNLPAFDGFALRDGLSRTLNMPAVLENDANCYALGEWRFGAGRGRESLACFTLGTGVGGGLILDRLLVVGPLGIGGELGHMTIEPSGRLCPCGAAGCLEAYASATSLIAMLAEALAQNRPTSLTGGASLKDLARAAEQGDALAGELFASAGRALGRAAAILAVAVGLDCFIIGGGVSASWSLMAPAARRELSRRLHLTDPARVSIMQAQLGDEAPMLGAAALAAESLRG